MNPGAMYLTGWFLLTIGTGMLGMEWYIGQTDWTWVVQYPCKPRCLP